MSYRGTERLSFRTDPEEADTTEPADRGPRHRSSTTPDRVRIRIDRSSPTPPFEQVVMQVRRAVDQGALAPGTRVPTVRALAEQLGLVPNTVAKAYRALEAAGYLRGRGRAGTFVAGERAVPSEGAESLDQAATGYLERARELGADLPAALEAVRRAGRH